MEFSTSSQRCRPSSREPTTTSILFRDTELKLKSNMRFFKSNMRARKRRLMTNSREFSKLKRNSISSTVLLSK
jgi:hypothetical protein